MGAVGAGCMPGNTDAIDQRYEPTPRARVPSALSYLIQPCMANCNEYAGDVWRTPHYADEGNPYSNFRFNGDEVKPTECMVKVDANHEDMGARSLGEGPQQDEQNDIHRFYRIERESLGAGAYGICHRAHSKRTDEIRAVKTIFKTKPQFIEWAREEMRIMMLLDHPNIIKLHETFEDDSALHIIMELCAGESLIDKLRDGGYFTQPQAMVLMRQILQAVHYVHSMGICHRDLKPENFLLLTKVPIERNTVKMIDFGMSCAIKPGEMLATRLGTPYFTAPEVVKGRYNEACDIWSCGVMLYIFLCGQVPFSGSNKEEILKAVEHGNFQFTGNAWRKVSDEAKDLVRGCITYDPIQRMTANQALNHLAITRTSP